MNMLNKVKAKSNNTAQFKNLKADTFKQCLKQIRKSKYLYLMLLPGLIYFIIFKYWPMLGLQIAFKKYNIVEGFWRSPWVGFRYFKQFFNSIYFWRLLRNTLAINLYGLIFAFPSSIILALMLNEVKNNKFKKTVQTISYLPHFISAVITVSMATQFLSPTTGIINNLIETLGGERIYFLSKPDMFWGIYTAINIWKNIGWGSIIYLAALSNIDYQLYEAAIIDGANRWKQLIYITIPCLLPTIVILLILRIGNFLETGFQTIILLYNTNTYETADVIDTYVYRMGLLNANYSYATAVGMFQSFIGLGLVIMTNTLAKKLTENSLW